MIKAVLDSADGRQLVLGLVPENVEKLMAGQPIAVNVPELVGDTSRLTHVIIVGGATGEAITAEVLRVVNEHNEQKRSLGEVFKDIEP